MRYWIDEAHSFKCDPDYWDCECKTNYIHPKEMKRCPKCGVGEEDSPPDARAIEVDQMRMLSFPRL